MSYIMNISISVSSCQTGLALNAQLVDSSGADTGEIISTGFSEIGNGHYLWNYPLFPDGFRGAAKFFENGSPGTILAFLAINPEEVENTDIKTSDVNQSRIMSVNELKNMLLSDAPVNG